MFFLPNYEAVKVLVDDHVADLRQAASGGRPVGATHHRRRIGWWGEARQRSTR